jgi:hypothetical protein
MKLVAISGTKRRNIWKSKLRNLLTRRRNHFSQPLNIYGVNDVRQTEIHTAEPVVPEPNAFEVEMAIENLKSHRSLLIISQQNGLEQGVEQTALRYTNLYSIWNNEKFPEEWKQSIIVPMYKKHDKRIVVIVEAFKFCQQRTKFHPTSCCEG